MSVLPVLGHAFQAPKVTAPNAVPRVTANQVEPRPIAAATARDNSAPNSSRTKESDQNVKGRDAATRRNRRGAEYVCPAHRMRSMAIRGALIACGCKRIRPGPRRVTRRNRFGKGAL